MEENHIKALSPLKQNPRKHNARNIGMIVDSLHEVGAARSIVIDENNEILAGNGTVEAAAEAGITKMQIVEADGETIIAVRRRGLTDVQKARLAVIDNRANETSDWDTQVLAEMAEQGVELDDLWSEEELSALLAGLEDGAAGGLQEGVDPDEVPENAPTRCQSGDLWQLGKHRLLCGDSTKAEDVARLMGGEKAALCLTDPPYGIGIAANPVRQKHAKSDWDNQVASAVSIQSCLSAAPVVIIWGGNYFELPPSQGFYIWDKKQPEDFSTGMCEMAWTNTQAPAKIYRESVTSYSKQHPTQKPVGLMAWCIEKTKEGIVFDPFLGSGTTLVAAEKIGRRCYGIEISPTYCDVILQRWENATGQTVVRLEGGK